MENQENSSGRSPKSEWISSFVHLILSYYSEVISNPFRTGLVHFAIAFVGVLFVGWILFPIALYSSHSQQVDFSHVLHVDPDVAGIEGDTELERCLYCHELRDDGSFTGIPGLAKCMECHDDSDYPLGEDPREESFLREYVANKTEIPWLSYAKQPDCVYFSHIAHVKMGNIECKMCHGDHQNTDTLPVYKKNRISGYSINIWGKNILGYKQNTWDRMKMDDCAECHTKNGHEENNACFVCHK